MKTKIKICGMRRVQDIEVINQYPISYVGFIFAKSKRQVDVEKVKKITKDLRSDIKKVGVFVNESVEKINEIVRECSLDIVQLHGDETDDDCKNVIAPVWKVISVKDKKSIEKINDYKNAVGFLLDTYSKDERGGTGKVFYWDWVKGLSDDKFIILAGGLNPDNIENAIKTVKPQVVDVNSGVENDLYKDASKIEGLFSNFAKIK